MVCNDQKALYNVKNCFYLCSSFSNDENRKIYNAYK